MFYFAWGMAFLYTVVAFLAEAMLPPFRPLVAPLNSLANYPAALAASLASLALVFALLELCSRLHDWVQLWLGRYRTKHKPTEGERTDFWTTFMPLAGVVLGFIASFFTGRFGWLEWLLQIIILEYVLFAMGRDMYDTPKYWGWLGKKRDEEAPNPAPAPPRREAHS